MSRELLSWGGQDEEPHLPEHSAKGFFRRGRGVMLLIGDEQAANVIGAGSRPNSRQDCCGVALGAKIVFLAGFVALTVVGKQSRVLECG